MTKKKKGRCHICKEVKILTYEHIPPKCAFNDKRVLSLTIEGALASLEGEKPKKSNSTFKQRGFGKDSLCKNCNSNTGTWYASSYGDFAFQAAHSYSSNSQYIAAPYYIYPLRVIKQIICMFFATDISAWGSKDLTKFVLNKNSKWLPDNFAILAYKVDITSKSARFLGASGGSSTLTLNESTSQVKFGSFENYGEIAYFPLGFILLKKNHYPEALKLFCRSIEFQDITYFSQYAYDDFAAVYLKMPNLKVDTPFLGDYRTREEVQADIKS